jgi:hypothetical protein
VIAWDATFERECQERVAALTGGTERERHWQELLVKIAPHVEHWAARNRALGRWRLDGEDDVRAVLVAVLGRLGRDDYAALRRFRDRGALDDGEEDDEQRAAVDRLARMAGAQEPDDEPVADPDARAGSAATPLRALLLTLVKRAAADHVRYRLGWTDQGGRRIAGTHAERLSDVPETGARPPITDYVTVRRLLDDIERFAEQFPPPMRSALRLWTQDASFADIARELALADEAAARKLVRSAHARLRERFRGEWAALL